jgi:hypothetical protein
MIPNRPSSSANVGASSLATFAHVLTALLLLTAAPLPAQPALAPDEVLIERTMLPDAHASSFAFGLPGGFSFCYDPIRGGLNYAWTGGFLDVTPVRPVNKLIKPAALVGTVVYRETGPAPLRRGDPTREPTIVFKGYTLRPASVELRYTVDGAAVSEDIRVRPDRAGLTRTFRFDASAADATWFHVVTGRPATALTPAGGGVLTLDVPFAAPAP